jgi:MarR family transcriptional regulator, organic hydroperoxide resistance regulator
MGQFENLKLANQLCHPIYSTANALTRLYKPLLKPLGITYPQYLVLMALWEKDGINMNSISQSTFFDSGTLTPLVQKLKQKGLIQIEPDKTDLRNKIIRLTKKGHQLKIKAAEVPRSIGCLVPLSKQEMESLSKMIRALHQSILDEEQRR